MLNSRGLGSGDGVAEVDGPPDHVDATCVTSLPNVKDSELDAGIRRRWLLLSQTEHEFWWQGQHRYICRGEAPCSVSVYLPSVGNLYVLNNLVSF